MTHIAPLWHLLSFAWRVTLWVPSNIFSWLALHQPTIKAFHLWCFKSWPTKIRQRRTRCFIVAAATSSNWRRERPGQMLFSTFSADVNLKIILSFQLKLLSFYSLFCNLLQQCCYYSRCCCCVFFIIVIISRYLHCIFVVVAVVSVADATIFMSDCFLIDFPK